jgi:biofilm PGA synthesis N-glycosyltransferase PgaC
MTVSVAIYTLVYIVFVFIGKTGISRHFQKRQDEMKLRNSISLDNITLIIPFRNEIHRISPLLQSISQSAELPKNIIFVDDHSDDNTHEYIKQHLRNIPYQLFQNKEKGKKGAIKTGIENSVTPYILTMDADVTFSPSYFSNLNLLAELDMHILPVKMSAKGWKKLFELDVYMINGLNVIADGIKRPIAASGANLLFKREAYHQVNSYSSHSSILSGDDQFLLADFNNSGLTVALQTDSSFVVTTPVPNSIKELVTQRLRWISKTPKVKDSFALKIGSIQLLTSLGFFLLGIWILINTQFLVFVLLILIKSIADIVLVKPYFSGIKKQGLLFLIPVYEILLPFYTLILSIMALLYKPRWKGRK